MTDEREKRIRASTGHYIKFTLEPNRLIFEHEHLTRIRVVLIGHWHECKKDSPLSLIRNHNKTNQR